MASRRRSLRRTMAALTAQRPLRAPARDAEGQLTLPEAEPVPEWARDLKGPAERAAEWYAYAEELEAQHVERLRAEAASRGAS